METNNDTQYEDAEAFSYSYNKDKLNFQDIILLHLKKIGEYASVEFRGGFWQTQEVPAGSYGTITQKVYVPDSRETYSNAIAYFADALFPYFDEEMMEAFKVSEEEEDKVLNDNTVEVEPDREDQSPSDAMKYRTFKNISQRRNFRSERVRISRKLFRALCCFLYRKKYLEVGALED